MITIIMAIITTTMITMGIIITTTITMVNRMQDTRMMIPMAVEGNINVGQVDTATVVLLLIGALRHTGTLGRMAALDLMDVLDRMDY